MKKKSRPGKVPVITQSEVAECGLTCLAMVLGAYGGTCSMRELRARFPASIRGMTLGQLTATAEEMGMDAHSVEFDLDATDRLPLPAILHWNHDHFVVLVSTDGATAVIHDPGTGRRRMPIDELTNQATGAALLVRPGLAFDDTAKVAQRRLTFATVTGGVHGIARPLLRILGMAMALELVGVLTPLAGQLFVDHAIPSHDRNLLLHAGVAFGLLFLAQAILNAARSWSLIVLGNAISLSWGRNVFAHLMRLRMSFFDHRSLGDVLSRFESINAIQFTLTNRFVETLLDGAMALFTAVVLVVYSGTLATVTFGCFAAYAVMRAVLIRPLEHANVMLLNASASVQSILVESIRGAQTIKLNDAGDERVRHYGQFAAKAVARKLALERLNVSFTTVAGAVQGLHGLLVLVFGAWLVMNGRFSVGALLAYAMYSAQFTDRATKLLDYAMELRMLGLHADRLGDIVATDPEPEKGLYGCEPADASIEFRNVSFRYHRSEPYVLHDCSFTIDAHEVVAITGASGCGKTTLAKLLLGLLEPESGQILVGGVDVRDLGKKRLRQQLACVLQDDQVFAGSIADNIHFFSATPDIERMHRCARLAEIDRDVENFWMGYRTVVGDMGTSLSAGQRQRLLIARALYRQPSVLILDEATSHLDVKNERLVARSLRGMGMTRIVIAHRPQTIAMTNRVLAFDAGGKVTYRMFEDTELEASSPS